MNPFFVSGVTALILAAYFILIKFMFVTGAALLAGTGPGDGLAALSV